MAAAEASAEVAKVSHGETVVVGLGAGSRVDMEVDQIAELSVKVEVRDVVSAVAVEVDLDIGVQDLDEDLELSADLVAGAAFDPAVHRDSWAVEAFVGSAFRPDVRHPSYCQK